MILGAVLAGGRSSRFGSDKAMARWRGRPLIDHVLERLTARCDGVLVCGRRHGGHPHAPDRPAADLGPLGGLNAALHHARDRGFDRVLSMPCDAPTIDDALVAAVVDADGPAFLARMPVIGLWRASDADRLEARLLAGGDRSMRAFAAEIGARPLDLRPPPNLNRLDDLLMLEGPASPRS